jgi:hypothetical protein
MKTKALVKENVETTKVVLKNLGEFTDAVCLTAVSGYAIYEALQKNHRTFAYKLLLVAGCVIALQAFVLLVRHFNKPEAK